MQNIFKFTWFCIPFAKSATILGHFLNLILMLQLDFYFILFFCRPSDVNIGVKHHIQFGDTGVGSRFWWWAVFLVQDKISVSIPIPSLSLLPPRPLRAQMGPKYASVSSNIDTCLFFKSLFKSSTFFLSTSLSGDISIVKLILLKYFSKFILWLVDQTMMVFQSLWASMCASHQVTRTLVDPILHKNIHYKLTGNSTS